MGLGRPGLAQYLATFVDMSKKVIVEYSRYPVAFVALFVQVFLIILLLMMSVFVFSAPGTEGADVRVFAGMMAYGFVTNIFLSFTLWEVGWSVREEQVRGTLESLYLSPTNQFSNLLSRVFAVLLWTAIMCAAGLGLVSGIVGGLPATNLLLGLGLLGLNISGFLGLGFLFAGVTIKLKETAQILVSFLQFFFFIFSAQFFPFAVLPKPVLDYVSRFLPVSYAVDLFRTTLLGIPPELLPNDLALEYAIVIGFGVLSPVLGYLGYKRIERKARLEGTLGEY
ncbi:MAG: hypothetical protein A3K59_00845 [Euryarchaeota archaeon RBG_19FT_COMBO_69_17]|nr:MAG: hypothetical protein A3K59_00845 [Euryarchaeota archaeon RBG_19FT_COMBO_69_17]